jgi:hypothetical protein
MMWMPLRSAKMNRRIFGFQRRVWCPKCTPAASSWLSMSPCGAAACGSAVVPIVGILAWLGASAVVCAARDPLGNGHRRAARTACEVEAPGA